LPLVRWLASQYGINFFTKQRQGHTALHKATWGGHLALVQYLREEIGMWDDQIDDAGNYAASLADMANTERHNRIALYLRRHCSHKKYKSLKILGLIDDNDSTRNYQQSNISTTTTAIVNNKHEIRKAYLNRARELHPDRVTNDVVEKMNNGNNNNEVTTKTTTNSSSTSTSTSTKFDELHKAYIHLTEEDGIGDQCNPAHSLNLMLQYVNNVNTGDVNSNGNGNGNININGDQNQNNVDKGKEKNDADEEKDQKSNNDEKNDDDDHRHRSSKGGSSGDNDDDKNTDDSSFFKARLIAVLLEYGDKGIDLSNVKKKWKQVWPKIPFPSQQQKQHQQQIIIQEDDEKNYGGEDDNEEKQQQQQSVDSTNSNNNTSNSNSNSNSNNKIIPLADFLVQKAGDIIRLERIGEKNRRVIVHVAAKHHHGSNPNSKESILQEASKQRQQQQKS